MNMKRIFTLLLVAGLILIGSEGCKKDTFDINQNPNQPTDSTVSYNVILPAALSNTARFVARDWGFLQNWLGYWARSGTYAPAASEESYNVTTSFGAGIWTDIYDNLYDYQTMQIGAQKAGADFYSGIARIMKAHNYAMLVDIYNNVPYSEALNGAGNTTPKYDKGADIYKDLLRQIDTGMALIKGASTSTTGANKSIAADDVMFGTTQFAGTTIDAMKLRWAKFGNTLKLRLLTHLMNGGITTTANPTSVTQVPAGFDIPGELLKITTDQTAGAATGFLTVDAQVNPGYSTTKPNPFYNLYVANTDGTATQNSVYYKGNSYAVGDGSGNGYYQYNGDTRIDRFYVAPSAGHRGVAYGLPSATENAAATLDGIGPGVTRGATAPVWILTLAESYFLQAEVVARGYTFPGTAANLVKLGVESSFISLGLTQAQGDTYFNGNAGYVDVDVNGTQFFGPYNIHGGVYTVLSQKWFALNAIAPYEVWSDYKRGDIDATTKHMVYGVGSGFAPGPPISVYQFNTATQIPVRLLYPQNEYNYNAGNVGAEGVIDATNSHVFWDLN